MTPHADALRLAGTLELVRHDNSINRRRVEVILCGAAGVLNLGALPVVREVWRGLRPCAPDGMPLIGRARARRRLARDGSSDDGLKTTPATGVLLAQLMSGETPSFDPEPFRADRY